MVALRLAPTHAQKDKAVQTLTKGVEFLLRKNKVEGTFGTGRILGPGLVEVVAAYGATRTLETRNILIAEPAKLAGAEGWAMQA